MTHLPGEYPDRSISLILRYLCSLLFDPATPLRLNNARQRQHVPTPDVARADSPLPASGYLRRKVSGRRQE